MAYAATKTEASPPVFKTVTETSTITEIQFQTDTHYLVHTDTQTTTKTMVRVCTTSLPAPPHP